MEDRNPFVGILVLMMFLSCSSTSKLNSGKQPSQELVDLISSRNFEVQMDWASPMNTVSLQNVFNALMPIGSNSSRINLMGISSFLRVEADTVTADLPYYGERQMGGGYNAGDGGIKFEAVPTDFKVDYNESKNQYEISFSAKQRTESYDVNMIILSNFNSFININSSQRFSIRYEGKVQKLGEKD